MGPTGHLSRALHAAAAAGVLALATSAPATATFPGANGRIASSEVAQGRAVGLTLVDPETNEADVLAPRSIRKPSVAADGSKIAFTRQDGPEEVFVVNADGTGERSLGPGFDPAWSPDGTRIAFATASPSQLVVAKADGSGRSVIGTAVGTDTHWLAPDWSPDGSTIVFMESLTVNDRRGSHLRLISASGGAVTPLTHGPSDAFPEWSPDGQRILFTRRVDDGASTVAVVNADGSGQRELARASEGVGFLVPVWSPDGRQFAFVRGRPAGDHVITEIVIRDVAGGPEKVVPRGSHGLDWQPVKDRDGDALLDVWEEAGIDADGDGTIDLDLPAMGADPDHKDVFVELDFMPPHEIEQDAVNAVVEAFASAPVDNPDGTTGVTLHVDNGSGSVMDPRTGARWGSRSGQDALPHRDVLGTTVPPGDYDWTDFDAEKALHFAEEREAVFRYGISAHGHPNVGPDGPPTGESRDIPASDFIITLGSPCQSLAGIDCTFTAKEQAGTLMHELGHILGLMHGGGDHVKNKPNYLSVMNYNFQFEWLFLDDLSSHLDFARFGLPALDETALDEARGLGAAASGAASFLTIIHCPSGAPNIWSLAGAIDFNCNGSAAGVVSVDTNADGGIGPLAATTPDWPRLVFRGGAVGALGAPVLPRHTPLLEPGAAELLEAQRTIRDYVAARRAPGAPGGEGAAVAAATPPAFGRETLVTLRLAGRRIRARGPLAIRIANANGFAVTARLSGHTTKRVPGSRRQRIGLEAKRLTVPAKATRTVRLSLPRALRRLLARHRRLSLRLSARVQDPAGNVRTLHKTVTVHRKRSR